MEQLLAPGVDALVFWAAIFASLVVVAVYVIGKVRPRAAKKERPASQLLAKSRELHSRGGLSDAEFRTIETTLAPQVQEELKGNGETL
jgi:uncharacterized membrane protein